MANATVIERRPLRNGKYKTESDEQMESEKNWMISKPVDCGYVYLNLLLDFKMLSEKILNPWKSGLKYQSYNDRKQQVGLDGYKTGLGRWFLVL